MDLSAPGSHFNHAIMNGDFKRHFNDQELLEMSVYIREPELSYADSFDDATLTCSSFPSSRGGYLHCINIGHAGWRLYNKYTVLIFICTESQREFV